jgi:hypothetical protein
MWADGWRYYQFRDNAGPGMSFNGSVNVKALLDYLVNTRQFSPDLWVTRLEVGSEIDDETQGTVTMQNITFEVNGQSRSPVFGQCGFEALADDEKVPASRSLVGGSALLRHAGTRRRLLREP